MLSTDATVRIALSFKHLMMMGFALGLGSEDKRMHKVTGTILNEAHDATQKSKKSGTRHCLAITTPPDAGHVWYAVLQV